MHSSSRGSPSRRRPGVISTPGRKSCLQSQAGVSVWQVLTVVALLTVDLGPQKVHGGTGFFNGTILDEFIDVPRRLERRYPYNNMTSSSLNQYREDIRNGNDYNLVGDNVGDATTFNDSYVRRFVTTSTSLGVGRSDLVAVSVAGKILFAGGVTGDLMGQQSRRVDVFDASTETLDTALSGEHLSAARQGIAATSDGTDYAYFGGGWSVAVGSVEVTPHAVVDIFQLSTQTWTSTQLGSATRFGGRYDMEAEYFQGKVYFAGGTRGLGDLTNIAFVSTVDVYDPSQPSGSRWSLLPGPPSKQYLDEPTGMYKARANFGLIGYSTSGYLVFAGGVGAGKYYTLAEPSEYIVEVDIWDANAGAWLPQTQFPSGVGRASLAAARMNNYAYFAGGATAQKFADVIDIMNMDNAGWVNNLANTPTLSQPRSGAVAATVISAEGVTALLVVGGITMGGTNRWFYEAQAMASPRIDIFETNVRSTTGIWHDYLPQAVKDTAIAAAGGKFFVAGGVDNMHRYSDRVVTLAYKDAYICTSVERDEDLCAHRDMTRIYPTSVQPHNPSCNYRFLPPYIPWYCPCRNPIARLDFSCPHCTYRISPPCEDDPTPQLPFTWGLQQQQYNDIQMCARSCFPCTSADALGADPQGPCVKPGRFEAP